MRTSKITIFVRATGIVFVIYMMMAWACNTMTQSNFWKPSEMAIAAVVSVLFYGGFAWLVTNAGMGLLFGRNARYRNYRNSGGDPFFDSLPPVFNPDSQVVRQTGMAEPETNFVPPAKWQFRCPQCNARVQHRIDVCWNCSYGADSDNTAYFDRYGDERPPEISEEDWEQIKRRHNG